MAGLNKFDWTGGTDEQHLSVARTATGRQLRRLARRYDWAMYPEVVLGWVMAQKEIDLGTALTVFQNGEPERFNYMPKRDVTEEFRGAARILDNICLRVNSGFYLAVSGAPAMNQRWLEKWLSYQAIDRAEGRRGRWLLDEKIVAVLLEESGQADRGHELSLYREKSGWMCGFLEAVKEAGLSQKVTQYLPWRDDRVHRG